MGSGANNTARYLGAAIGITLFVIVATHAGDSLARRVERRVLVAAGLTLVCAAVVAAAGVGSGPVSPAGADAGGTPVSVPAPAESAPETGEARRTRRARWARWTCPLKGERPVPARPL